VRREWARAGRRQCVRRILDCCFLLSVKCNILVVSFQVLKTDNMMGSSIIKNDESEADRRIVRPKPHSPGTFATIVGLIPRVEEISWEEKAVVESKSGRVDSSSGLSIVCLNYSNSTASICIWENITCTLSEKLHRQQKCSFFYHPEYVSDTQNLSPLTENMIALHPLGGSEPSAMNTDNTVQQQRRPFYFSLYAASSNGVVCLWNDALPKSSSPITKADAVFRLNLEEEEIVTFVQSITSLDVVLVGTNQGRVWIVSCRCSWPLQLEARQMSVLPSEGTRRKTTGVLTSFFGSMYSSSSSSSTTEALTAGANSSSGIINIFVLRPESRVDDTPASHLATPLRPSQRARLFRTPPKQSLLILRKNFELSKLTIHHNTSNSGAVSMTTVLDGSTNLLKGLHAFLAQEWNQSHISNKNTIVRVKVLRSTCSRDTDCLFLVLRVSNHNDHRRLYMVQCKLSKSDEVFTASIVHGQYLNKYPSDIVQLLHCKGLDVVTIDNDNQQQDNNMGDMKYLVYSTWQKQHKPVEAAMEGQKSLSLTTFTVPVTCTVSYFPSTSNSNTVHSIFDLDLPRYAAPEVIGTGMTATSEGTLIITDEKLISVVVKLDWTAAEKRSTIVPLASLPSSSLASPDIQSLISHLSDAFRQYNTSIARHHGEKNATDASIAASLPPSLYEARQQSLNIVIEYVSLMLCNDAAKSNNTPSIVVQQKLIRHKSFVNFLHHSGLYRKLSSARRKLMDHGEMLQTCISLLDWVDLDKSTLTYFDVQGLNENCTEVLSKLYLYQTASIQSLNDDGTDYLAESTIISTSKTICNALESAQIYRMKHIDVLYDVPPKGSCGYLPPWTSCNELRVLLLTQLRHISSKLSCDSLNSETAKPDLKHIVFVLGNALLQSYFEDDRSVDSNELDLAKQYHQAKVETINLFLLHLSTQEALDASLKHQFFDGIVKICEQEDKIFNDFFIDLLQRGTEPDVLTGKTFPLFVFSYFCEKGQFADVLDLGRHCNAVLQTFLEYEPKMYEYRWINDFRVGKFEDGATCLSHLKSENASTSAAMDRRMIEGGILMSLGKLADLASDS
jgi:hypothetical protein